MASVSFCADIQCQKALSKSTIWDKQVIYLNHYEKSSTFFNWSLHNLVQFNQYLVHIFSPVTMSLYEGSTWEAQHGELLKALWDLQQ